jgi:ArsR family transcriptional regulator
MRNVQVGRLETLLKALADGTRLRILALLANGEVCVCHIHESLRISQPKASRHLAYLRRAGLVATRRDGLWVHYRLAASVDPPIATIQQAVIDALAKVGTVRDDSQRLRRRTAVSIGDLPGDPAPTCCEPVGVAAHTTVARIPR